MPQRNALAPPSRNALQADPVQQLLKQASEAPQYGELVDYLSARRAMPPIRQQPLGVRGSFDYNTSFGDDLPRTGVVTLGFGARPATVVHELTHAAERQIHHQAFDLQRKSRNQKLNNQEKQFLDGLSLVRRKKRLRIQTQITVFLGKNFLRLAWEMLLCQALQLIVLRSTLTQRWQPSFPFC
jgi:hypothetical protein